MYEDIFSIQQLIANEYEESITKDQEFVNLFVEHII